MTRPHFYAFFVSPKALCRQQWYELLHCLAEERHVFSQNQTLNMCQKKVSECMLHIDVSLWSPKKQMDPVIPVALYQTTHQQYVIALCWLMGDLLQTNSHFLRVHISSKTKLCTIPKQTKCQHFLQHISHEGTNSYNWNSSNEVSI
jgi:hypothetical protein